MQRLFVYGTLAPGRPNEHVLANIGGSWRSASVKGNLRQEGWGAELGYPVIVLDETGDEVKGFLFTSKNLADHWQTLDEFEGDGYERKLTSVTLDDGSTVDAYVYAMKSSCS